MDINDILKGFNKWLDKNEGYTLKSFDNINGMIYKEQALYYNGDWSDYSDIVYDNKNLNDFINFGEIKWMERSDWSYFYEIFDCIEPADNYNNTPFVNKLIINDVDYSIEGIIEADLIYDRLYDFMDDCYNDLVDLNYIESLWFYENDTIEEDLTAINDIIIKVWDNFVYLIYDFIDIEEEKNLLFESVDLISDLYSKINNKIDNNINKEKGLLLKQWLDGLFDWVGGELKATDKSQDFFNDNRGSEFNLIGLSYLNDLLKYTDYIDSETYDKIVDYIETAMADYVDYRMQDFDNVEFRIFIFRIYLYEVWNNKRKVREFKMKNINEKLIAMK